MKFHETAIFLFVFLPIQAAAQWEVVTHANNDTNNRTEIASTTNPEGFSMEVYRDGRGVVRLRFSMNQSRQRLDPDTCPTYQIDSLPAGNTSINDAACISHGRWAEFIVGYIIDEQVNSSLLFNLMQGQTIQYRFRLRNAGYARTDFSLSGSRNTLNSVLGSDLTVNRNTP